MHRAPENVQAFDSTRRTLLKGAGFFFIALAGHGALPPLSHAAWKLVLPIPKRPPLSQKTKELRPKVAIVIDDIGNSLHLGREFLALPIGLTFSILPFRPFSRQLMDEIADAGHEILLHQPMEPFRQDIDPGPGAIYTRFPAPRIHDTIRANLHQINVAIGVNNHMGSKFTANREKVREALEPIKQDGLFFIDSLTTPRSVAYDTARSLHISTAHRNVFLDCRPDREATVKQMKRLVAMAIRWGKAIGIGHPFPTTLLAIKQFLSMYRGLDEKIEFVGVSRLISHGQ